MMDIWGGLDSYAAAATADERSRLLNGPRLEGDADHASQQDIDRMFN